MLTKHAAIAAVFLMLAVTLVFATMGVIAVSSQTECIETIDADATISGAWEAACRSEKPAPGGGERYARFYTFTLQSPAQVSITLRTGHFPVYPQRT